MLEAWREWSCNDRVGLACLTPPPKGVTQGTTTAWTIVCAGGLTLRVGLYPTLPNSLFNAPRIVFRRIAVEYGDLLVARGDPRSARVLVELLLLIRRAQEVGRVDPRLEMRCTRWAEARRHVRTDYGTQRMYRQ